MGLRLFADDEARVAPSIWCLSGLVCVALSAGGGRVCYCHVVSPVASRCGVGAGR